jgi:hypothetical protein
MKMLALAAPLALAAAALAQPGTGGTITHNNATFTQGDVPLSSVGTGPVGEFRVGGPGNPNHYFQSWWWARFPGDTREHALYGPATANWGGSLGQLNYSFPGLPVVQTYQVIGTGSGGVLVESITLTNTSNQPLSANLFHYLDLDLNGSASGDSAVLNGPNSIKVTDGPWTAHYEGSGTYEVGGFPTVRDLLTNNSINNFSNSGLPFGPGDWTGGWQWSFTLQPNDMITLTASLSIIPAPASAAVLALGGLVAARRRRS